MQLQSEELAEFIKLYQEEFGDNISEEAAREIANRLLVLYELMAQRDFPSGLSEDLTATS
jgi:hypothetical protein